MMEKYANILNSEYKEKVINMIKTEVQEKSKELKNEELEHFCNNVFTVATLSANNIEEQEIENQIMDLNNKFLYDCKQKGIAINSEISKEQMELTSYLNDKYTKIIFDITNK